jgi:hypothetical protein
MEILDEDLLMLQEQNQMTLLLSTIGFVQFNAQYYGEGFDEDGRERNLLRGSLWAVPQYYTITISRPEPKSAATSSQEIYEIIQAARERNIARSLQARTESFANRATRDQQRATGKMPPRRGTNTHIQIYGPSHYGPGKGPNPF